ncbi:bifunctional 5,10-methylenetetrahydrofolate dehydrogenase/5,10-methenyltetrahydrofolate cyclohydrolase [Candidatus Saccharibacteria bacterium]|nr:bifunctional 5,10-methylenetetrahydrofolate dehydrogenase/5,10-methenyltetrahydrofolate cyclohydrolase [Candidatus Saccharibacteria bacterium]NCU40508.1 bifunctional 5,10-methylenetetrahydrofolate dehydrogenase/5,10-methenyltetrahydrofolate cyclohydrolase [Candidatus Saccharibacteria bacterium]
MKSLNGAELASYIKARQARQVRALRQAHGVFPHLAIIQTTDDPVINTYVRLKKIYGEEILIDVVSYRLTEDEALVKIRELNDDNSVHGIIVQLPLHDTSRTDELVDAVLPEKDVDALGQQAILDPATPMAINWLLAGYNVDLKAKKIVIVGNGRLVGAPLARMWRNSGYDVTVLDKNSPNIEEKVYQSDVVVTAAGQPNLITSDMLKQKAVVVDAATASENGEIVGDVATDVRERDDIAITPVKGGVGPLTVTALFDNVIRSSAASKQD